MKIGAASSSHGPRICKPTGNPSSVNPMGTAVARNPVMTANEGQKIRSVLRPEFLIIMLKTDSRETK
jgi:hypothetical protein